jgi:hypothetical protein
MSARSCESVKAMSLIEKELDDQLKISTYENQIFAAKA